ncbi:MAG: hypothetical protein CML99_16530 [Rhodobiaceae bacterium]|nr:hypothetical protein [Rhodobiaceae bacterium]
MIKDAALVAVYGPRGSGKSTLVRALIDPRQNVIAFDPIADYAQMRGWEAVQMTGHAGEDRKRLSAAAKRALKRKKFRMAAVPFDGQEDVCLHNLALWMFDLQRGYREGRLREKLTLVIEEMDLSFPVSKLPKEMFAMAKLCNQGRHWGLEAIAVTQFPQQISKTFRNNATVTYAFKLPDTPRRAVEENMADADKPALRGLKKYEFVQLSIDGMKRGKTLASGKVQLS